MEKIERPKEVSRAQKNYQTNEQYQDYSSQEFKNIYDYLDGLLEDLTSITRSKVIYKKDNNSNTSITLDETVENYDYVEVFYRVDRGDGYEIRGSQKVLNPANKYFDVSVVFYNSPNVSASASLFKIGTTTIVLQTSTNYQFGNGTAPVLNTNNAVFINQVIGYKRKE